MLPLKEKMKKEIRENIKELVNYCRNGGVASIATDMYEFDWYAMRICSPYEAYIVEDAVPVKKGMLVNLIRESGLELVSLPGQSAFFLVKAS